MVYFVIFIVSGTSMHISFYLQWDVGSSPSVERWCILLSSSSVVRRCISPSTSSGTLVVHLQWNVGMCYRWWYGDTSLSTSSGTLVVHLQWNVGVFCYLHRQWYVDVFLFNTFSGTLVYVIVSGTSMNYPFYVISGTVVYFSSCLQWNVGICYRQWYGGTSFHIISGKMV